MKEQEITVLLKLSLQRALLGAIYPAIRAIAYEFNELKKLKIVFYLDREPNDDDYESVSDVCAEVLGDIEFQKIEEICEYTTKSFSELAPNNFVYLRKE
jgi:hypothetical protein